MLQLLLLACAPDPATVTDTPVDYAAPGPYAATRHTWSLTDASTARSFNVEVWAPAGAPPATAEPIEALLVDEEAAATYAGLLAAAPESCPSLTSAAGLDTPIASAGPWPLVLMSHCHGCTRFSTASVAVHLASHGFVVVAPDHPGDTLFDSLAGALLPLDASTLALREADLTHALDAALDGTFALDIDPARVGAFGHSFGAVTAAITLQDRLGTDGGPVSAMFVGAPPENPLLPGVSMELLDAPLMFMRLLEDHSVGEVGNLLMHANFEAAPAEAWEVDVADAGHWSPSDLVGLTADFMPGCGDDTREATGEVFTYLDPAEGRAITASTAAGFFDRTLNHRQ
ncbi:hypothetical protein LBMAG42_36970 [Deltaproteobacteria bacterium]|nr:hypothetical protein LBMAG42_36970 [Deltaproteobacteria bacterium]